MPSINATTLAPPTGVSSHGSSPAASANTPPAGRRWREAPEGGYRQIETTAPNGLANGPAIGRWQTQFHDGTGRARCELCPRRCTLKPGQRGFCFVRSNHDGIIVSDTYGCSSGFAVDPVEKKPFNHFHPGSSVLSFGTAGCNSGCRFCQNFDIAKARSIDKLSVGPARRKSRRSRPAVASTQWHSPTTTPSCSPNTPSTPPKPAVRSASIPSP